MVVRGVVLDVDDTLYLERDYVRSGFRHLESWVVATSGIVGVGAQAWSLFEGGVRNTTITDALAAKGGPLDGDYVKACIDEYRSHKPTISLLDDAREFLQTVHGDFHVAVVTDGPAVSQRAKCEALGLFDLASSVVISNELGTSKPDPRVFETAVEDWNISCDQLVYIADNPAKDFQGPLGLGWRAIRVRRPGALHFHVETPSGVDEVTRMRSEILL